MDPTNALLLLGEAVLYFTVMAVLFRLRHRFGMGIFLTALGAMHFLETYLAAVLYVQVPFGLASPGSVILFNASTWHGHTRNASTTPRRSLQATFIPRGGRPATDFVARMASETRSRLGPAACYLVGIDSVLGPVRDSST